MNYTKGKVICDCILAKSSSFRNAAPDMYEALKSLIPIAEATHGCQDRVTKAKQALNKAEGK